MNTIKEEVEGNKNYEEAVYSLNGRALARAFNFEPKREKTKREFTSQKKGLN